MNFNHILQEADAILEKHASPSKETTSAKENVKTASADPEAVTLAEELLKGQYDFNPGIEKVATSQMTAMEKIAHSMAIVDTLLNISELAKLEKTAQVAEESGYSAQQISEYIEKKASEMKLVSVGALIKDNFEGFESEKTAGVSRMLGKR